MKDLTKRATQQQACLDERDQGDAARAKLMGEGVKLVLDASHALAALKGALDERFPRQKDYVAAFFADVASRKKAAPPDPRAPPAPGPASPAPA